MEKESQVLDQIAKSQQQFYEENSKKRFFKNNQKLQCAKQVANQVDLQQMINLTYFNIPNTNIVYFNYMMFKTYASDDVKDALYTRFCSVISETLAKYGQFEMHCNLQTFTVSAAQRYYSMITSSIDENDDFSSKMTALHVYHTPSVIEQIVMVLKKSVGQFANRTVFHKKDESDALIQKLFEHL